MFTLIIASYTLDFKIPEIETIKLYDKDENLYLSYSNGRKKSYISIDEISKNAINAFLSIEDRRYYTHTGLDFIRICKAAIIDIIQKEKKEGASTITQQYARSLFLTSDKTWKRKISEMLIALNLEAKYSKDDILEGYLNSIYFDSGIYGIEDASMFYFNKSSKDLTLKESCILASIPKAPTNYSPIKNKEKNRERTKLILSKMLEYEFISNDEYNKALEEDVKLYGIKHDNENNNAPFFQDYVLSELKNIKGITKDSNKLKVYTTLDKNLNNLILKSINNRIESSGLETSIVVVEPNSGRILSLVGGKDYNESSYNRAVYSRRQPGSSIKPLLYLAAIENGFTPSTTFYSEPTTFYINKQAYSPKNFLSIYPNQEVSMTYALATSDNIYAVKTHLFIGMDKLRNKLIEHGINKDIPEIPSLALGTYEVSNLELSQAYYPLASSGEFKNLYCINKIEDNLGNIIYTNNTNTKRVSSIEDTYILNEAMTHMFDPNVCINIRPTGVSIASKLTNKYSGKSGSTDFDNWMIGYNKDILVSVWTGYDDNRIITKRQDTTCCKYIWADIVEGYLDKKKTSWYDKPDDVISVRLNPITGFYSSFTEYSKDIYFVKSNIPWYIRLLNTK